ncbi:MAG: hypothetical protein IPK03_13860 [Bacteroidetes bacterium]|nr:hypothetical protein [Bacteroidota bacterium]MBP7478773.1 ATPase [Chitinophagales bacterium]
MAKVAFELEFIVRSSPTILYEFVVTPTNLAQWFCEKCDSNGDLYTFKWKGQEDKAYLIDNLEDKLVAFQWVGTEDDEEFFEFAIQKNEISGDTVLVITDFAEPNEVEDMKMWWEDQIVKLKKMIGG